MKRSKDNKLIVYLIILLVVFCLTTLISTIVTISGAKKDAASEKSVAAEETQDDSAETEPSEVADENSDEIDYYSMQEYCRQNVKEVFAALSSGDSDALAQIMVSYDDGKVSALSDAEGVASVMDFADWSEADFDGAISMGVGSLDAEPDSAGYFDVSERLFVDVDGSRYVFFIETLTSERGSVDEGVCAVSVTSFSHFDATDYVWNGEKDAQSVIAGRLFRDR